ncbi:MAG: IS66 family transposase, partial [Polyangia bacterium]
MEIKSPPNDLETLKLILSDYESQAADKDAYISELEEKIRLLEAVVFGPKSEKMKPRDPEEQKQYRLFDEAENTLAAQADEKGQDIVVPGHVRKKPGRRPLPPDLPRVEVVHDLEEEDKTCRCGTSLTRIGQEVSEKLDIVPATIQVLRHVRYKYACRGCEGLESEGGAVHTAPMPPQIIPQGIVTPGLLAHVLTAKFVDGLPFYRQEGQLERMGVDLGRATMANWAIKTANACQPLIDLMLTEIRLGLVMNLDETTVQVLNEPGRPNTTKSYMWLARGGPPGKPSVLFRYEPSRSGKVAEEIVGDFQGYLQTDGYLGYDALGQRPGIRHMGCLAHVRRKFVEVAKAGGGKKSKTGTAARVVDLIANIYQLEKQADQQRLEPEQRQSLRQNEARPLLAKIKALLDERAPTTPPKSLLGKAITYARNQWERIKVYLENGNLKPDNNLAENAIRPFAVGRKNWLFACAPRGAQ